MVLIATRDEEVPTEGRRAPPARYWPGLDGMRAIAVTAVVVYHLAPHALPGGFLGVDIFFVVSGYLITTLLVGEWAKRDAVNLPKFWLRRIRRLYPAVVALLILVVPIAAATDPKALASARTTVVLALLYQTNWWFIFHHVSYFASFGPPPLFLHLWSLAIEEQYYLIWPLILAFLLKRWGQPDRVAVVALVGALLSSVLMAVLYHGGASLDRVYYGSDTHAQGLLIGSALGLTVPPTRLPVNVGARARRSLDRVAVVAFVGLAALIVLLSQSDAFTWRGGLLLAVLLTGVLVVAAAHPASRSSSVLSTRPMRWLGTRSYSVYLWHWPIIVLTAGLAGFAGFGLRVGLILVAAEVSFRAVEQPWRTGRAQRAIRAAREGSPASRWALGGAGVAVVAAVVVVLIVVGPPGEGPVATAAATAPVVAQGPPAVRAFRGEAQAPHRVVPGPTASSPPPAPPPPQGIIAVGDSVMLAASTDLDQEFGPAITVDAAVGRQPGAGIDRLAEYQAAGRLHDLRAVIVGLGSNGVFTPDDLTRLRAITAGVPLVVLINVRVPDPWGPESNVTIDAAAADPGVRVVDWYDASAAPGLLYEDAVHPDPAGQAVYAQLVLQAVSAGH